MHNAKVLIVEDEYNVADTIKESLCSEGYKVCWKPTGESALEYIKKESFDLTILDISLPGISGIELLKKLQVIDPSVPVLILTATDKAETAVHALKMGAFDYIAKPFELKRLLFAVKESLEERKQRKAIVLSRKVLEMRCRFENIIGNSKAMKKVYRKIYQAANSTANVLLLGSTGTGKELVARAIHLNSTRNNRPFKAINCSAIPDNLLESALFGHEQGAFTSAFQSRQGAMEQSNGGTLFLDEIGDLKLGLQVKLLRVLEERRLTPLGGTEEIAIDIRLLCSTNRNLKEMVGNGQFRKDLYYRINTFPIELPLLRDRKEDIPLLVEYFLKEFENKYGTHSISPEALNVLASYDWPGNVRELKHVVERNLVSLQGAERYTIYVEHIPEEIRSSAVLSSRGIGFPGIDTKISLKELLRQAEKHFIKTAIRKSNDNLTQAAHLLKITYPTLKYRMKRLGV